ncbi:hypothetical protein EfmAA96_17560 [Enterococcus faecium]|nr:hypothetical protein EfmAA96_17560 [Enterococcus faecium]
MSVSCELPWTKSAFISELKSPLPHLYLGIFDNGRMIGFIGSRAFGLDCHITNIAVRPAYQRKRIGSLLIMIADFPGIDHKSILL